MRVVFLGPPGVGKGTHASKLSAVVGAPHISTGDIFRQAVADKTELGLKAKTYMDAGELVPDDLVISIVSERITQDDCSKGFLLDGFPRTIKQAEVLDEKLSELNLPLDHVVYFVVDENELVGRITGRRFCNKCSSSFHVVNKPSKVEGQCDDCDGGELLQREDDREETIKNRLKVYTEQSEPLVSYYGKHDVLRKINTGGPIEQTYQSLLDAVGALSA